MIHNAINSSLGLYLLSAGGDTTIKTIIGAPGLGDGYYSISTSNGVLTITNHHSLTADCNIALFSLA